jgi:hypothetical protein
MERMDPDHEFYGNMLELLQEGFETRRLQWNEKVVMGRLLITNYRLLTTILTTDY